MRLVFDAAVADAVPLAHGVKRIGACPDADVVLRGHDDVLPLHCELHVGAQGVMLNIARGAAVAVNGRAVEGLIAVRAGDAISFGGVRATVVADARDRHHAQHADARMGALSLSAANDDCGATMVRAALPKFALRAQNGRALGRTYPVQGAILVGRTSECHVRIEDAGLSRKHARLLPNADGVVVEDLGSTNGSFHNGMRVQRAVVRTGDEIAFDTLRFRLIELGQDTAKPEAPAVAETAQAANTRIWIWAVLGGAVCALSLFLLLR